MQKRIIHTPLAPAPVGPYSQAVEAGGFVFCSGQIPINPETNEVVLGEVEGQMRLVMKNIVALLKGADLTLDNVVKVTMYLIDMADFTKVNNIYSEYFKDQAPARTTIAVKALPKGVSVEVEVLAQR